jgi:hypothetical protein
MSIVALLLAAALTQQPIPQPFPRPVASQPPPTTPSDPAAPPASPITPTQTASPSPQAEAEEPSEASLGVPVYPGAQFIASYDAGRGQRFYLFGTSRPYVDMVTYYRTLLDERGNAVFEAPATHVFEIGRFREDTMAFPPSVTIKDYESGVSAGYPNPTPGAEPERFRTVIQIVPVPPDAQR